MNACAPESWSSATNGFLVSLALFSSRLVTKPKLTTSEGCTSEPTYVTQGHFHLTSKACRHQGRDSYLNTSQFACAP